MEQTPLKGVYDLHVHTAPDVSPRKCDDDTLAQRATAAGMAGFVIKNHFAETASRAWLLQKKYPALTIAGGITLNRPAGGINPFAVERAAEMGARFVWFATLEAKSYKQYHCRDKDAVDLSQYISVFDENEKLLPQVYDVLDIAAKNHMVVSTGHVGANEGLALIKAAKERKVEYVVVTHCDNPADFYTDEQQLECVRYGAMLEHSYFTMAKGYTSAHEMKRQINVVGAGHVVFTTDLGQTYFPFPDEGMVDGIKQLLSVGVTIGQIETMTKVNPAMLMARE